MLDISGKNINQIFPVAMTYFNSGHLIDTTVRGQRRLVYPTPVATTYQNPRERVLFDRVRDANPFFHFMEALWILAGRNDVAWLAQWLPRIADYSDDGEFFHGAYGYRMMKHDQLARMILLLQQDPHTTRAVLAIYQPRYDSGYNGKDMPCNCTVFFGIHDGRLNMTVANRSNDMIWGTYGANVVQFSMLQEFVAGCLGIGVGWYVQMSNNAHVYPDNIVAQKCIERSGVFPDDPYDHTQYEQPVAPYDMMHNATGGQAWLSDLNRFINNAPDGSPSRRYRFFQEVASPMQAAHKLYRDKNYVGARHVADDIGASDWRLACLRWIERRESK